MVTLGTWGNALAMRLPSHIVKAARLRPGMEVDLRLRDDGSLAVKLVGANARRKASVADEEIPDAMPAAVQRPVVW